MSIGKLCQGEIVTISEEDSIQKAAKLMKEKEVGCLLVFKKEENENRKPVGILTDRDIIINIVAEKNNLEGIKVSDVMSDEILTLSSDQGIKECIESMHDKGVRRAPIMDNDKVRGIVAVDDLIVILAEELSLLADLINRQRSAPK